MTPSSEIGLSSEFLEKILGKTVSSYTVRPGTKPGDNYMSVLYALEVKISDDPEIVDLNNNTIEEDETMHLLCKCFPCNSAQQDFLIRANIFSKELCIYMDVVPEFMDFQIQLGMTEIIKLDLPPFITGAAVNFANKKGGVNNEEVSPMDNFLMMVDIRKTYGFRMPNRNAGLDLAHVSLAIDALAKMHAVSWAYKQEHKLKSLVQKFPCIHYDLTSEQDKAVYEYMLDSHLNLTLEILKETLGEESPEFQGTKMFRKISKSVSDIVFEKKGTKTSDMDFLLRKCPQKIKEREKKWNVLLHGDLWTNNMLFRYNETTQEPEEVILVDLQMCREGCPTTDLVYLIYTSTNSATRRGHLRRLLKLYVDKFNSYCNLLQCETLPGFNLESVLRRFHRAQLLGYSMAIVSLPIMLKSSSSSDNEEHNKNNNNILDESCFQNRIVAIAEELYWDGVI